MSLFDDTSETDDIFSSPSKPKVKPTKKPSFDALLDDESELFSNLQNESGLDPLSKSVEKDYNVIAKAVEDDISADPSSSELIGNIAPLSPSHKIYEEDDTELSLEEGKVNNHGKSSLFSDDNSDDVDGDNQVKTILVEGESMLENDDEEFVVVSYDLVPPVEEIESNPSQGQDNIHDIACSNELTYELRKEKHEKKSSRDELDSLPDGSASQHHQESDKVDSSISKGTSQGSSELHTPDPTSTTNTDESDSQNDVHMLARHLQEEKSSSLQGQDENLLTELKELREKCAKLEEDIKKKDRELKNKEAEIAVLEAKLISDKPSQSPSKPSQSPSKPSQTPSKPSQLPSKHSQAPSKPSQLPSKHSQLSSKPSQLPPSKGSHPPGKASHPPIPTKKVAKINSRPNSAEASSKTKLRAGVDKGRTVTSVAESVKKFSVAGAASPEPGTVRKPKPSTKKPEIKASASPALEAKATTAKSTSDVAKSTPALKKPTPAAVSKPRTSSVTFGKKMEKPVESAPIPAAENSTSSTESDPQIQTECMTQHVISLFEQKVTVPQVDTPPWKRQLKNCERGEEEEDSPRENKSPTKIKSEPATVNGIENQPPEAPSEEKEAESHSISTNSKSTSVLPHTSTTVKLREKNLKRTTSSSAVTDNEKKMSASDSGKRSSWMPKREVCAVCARVVYAMEKLEADKVVYHKTCFKCCVCTKTLSTGTYAALQGKIYCKVHFKQLFKMKGNYDEGFGREQHKTKWTKKDDESEADVIIE